ncbi:MAG: S1/P1 Nuclease, partial [Gammaproteobacteria bacterium]|nr:S1/P1 Nuclease [Gammaproteobacteria bacterium]
MKRPRLRAALLAAAALVLAQPRPARAWGAEGHRIVGLIAQHYLRPAVRRRVDAILATDHSGLVRGTGIAAESTWAD